MTEKIVNFILDKGRWLFASMLQSIIPGQQLARVIPFFAHPPEIRKVIYTTNAIESLNMSLRKVTQARGSFPNDEAVFKLLYLGAAQHCEEVDQVGARLESHTQPLWHRLRKPADG